MQQLDFTQQEKDYIDSMRGYFNDVACRGMPTPLSLEITKERDVPPTVEDPWHPHDDRAYFRFTLRAAQDHQAIEVAYMLKEHFAKAGVHFSFDNGFSFTMKKYTSKELFDTGEALLHVTPQAIKRVFKA